MGVLIKGFWDKIPESVEYNIMLNLNLPQGILWSQKIIWKGYDKGNEIDTRLIKATVRIFVPQI